MMRTVPVWLTKLFSASNPKEARRMLTEVWDGVTPLRQVGLGVSKLTHETFEQMSLFEDPKMEYYREWDRQYDADRAAAEDARLLAYERKTPPNDEITGDN